MERARDGPLLLLPQGNVSPSSFSPYFNRKQTGTASWLEMVQMGVSVTVMRNRSGLLMRTQT